MRLSHRGSLISAAVIAVVATVAAVVAAGASGHADKIVNGGADPIELVAAGQGTPAPDISAASAWDGSAPLTNASLKGKVVIVDFWDASCINCRRTFPFLQKLYATYKSHGLVIVGVHTPEFDFEKAHSYVARSVKELGITWPVAEDPDYKIWDSYQNEYWPAEYFIDRSGNVRGDHFGEGDEENIEATVRTLLDEGGSAGDTTITAHGPITPDQTAEVTPELYMGSERDGDDPAVLTYKGHFDVQSQYRAATVGASVTLSYQAKDVYSVIAPPSTGAATLTVTLNGKPVPAAMRGSDLTVGPGGETELVVTKQDLFHLLTGTSVTTGSLVLTAQTPGAELFTFTFGS